MKATKNNFGRVPALAFPNVVPSRPMSCRPRASMQLRPWAACLLLASLLASGQRTVGLEVDCRACNFCRGQPDLNDELTQRIKKHIAEGKSADQIAMLEGGRSILRPPIELWANRHPAAVRPDPNRLKYRGSHLPSSGPFNSIEPCVNVNGVCIGTDKLGHLFQQGWEYYQISVVDKKGDRMAERYGEWLEGKEPRDAYTREESYFRRQLSGNRVGYGGFGRTLTGVISNADLEANKAGLQMYKDLQNGRFKSLGDYVSSQLCEEVNPNEYTPEMAAIVQRNVRKWYTLGSSPPPLVQPQRGFRGRLTN